MLNALSKSPNEKPCNTIDTLIGSKTEIRGDITFSGGLRIDGRVRGNVTAKGDANSTLVLSENAQILGSVTAPHIISNGLIKGNVRAAERMELQPKAEIEGDVVYKSLEMALGAVINGKLVREGAESAQGKASVTRLKPVATGAPEESES
jgi:cytoskeletal protein CcmA (bactofilin family)